MPIYPFHSACCVCATSPIFFVVGRPKPLKCGCSCMSRGGLSRAAQISYFLSVRKAYFSKFGCPPHPTPRSPGGSLFVRDTSDAAQRNSPAFISLTFVLPLHAQMSVLVHAICHATNDMRFHLHSCAPPSQRVQHTHMPMPTRFDTPSLTTAEACECAKACCTYATILAEWKG